MAEFRTDSAGLRAFLRSGDLYPALEAAARPIESRAKGNAHVKSGQFRDSIHIERHLGTSRVTVRVVADSPGAAAIEARDRALGRAAG